MSYAKVYEAAIEQNYHKLWEALQLVHIDIWKPGFFYFSICSELAAKGEKEAVAFLIENGASPWYATIGATYGGNTEYAKELHEKYGFTGGLFKGAAYGKHGKLLDELSLTYPDNFMLQESGFNGIISGLYDPLGIEIQSSGLSKDNIADAVGISGNIPNAEKLIALNYDANRIACGVIIGGWFDYARQLLERKLAHINHFAFASAIYRNREFLNEFCSNADTKDKIEGASFSGDKQHIKELISLGANPADICIGALSAAHMPLSDQTQQIHYLAFYHPHIPEIANAFREYKDQKVSIESSTEARAIAIARKMEKGQTYIQAFVSTDSTCNGLLFFMMLLVVRYDSSFIEGVPNLSLDIWSRILDLCAPLPPGHEGWKGLGIAHANTHLAAQLSCYQGIYRDRNPSFFQNPPRPKNREEFASLIDRQATLLKEVTPDNNDRYSTIAGFWHNLLGGKEGMEKRLPAQAVVAVATIK